MNGGIDYFIFFPQGYDGESVTERELAKSIGCGKNFRGPDILDTKAKGRRKKRLLLLSAEISAKM